LYIKNGKPFFTYNFVGLQRTTISSAKTLSVGRSTIKLTFTYDGGGIGKGGLYTLFIDGKEVAESRVEQTIPMLYSLDETADVGIDDATPVVEDYSSPKGKFNGKIMEVRIDISDSVTHKQS
jgi:arylsulfatase